MRTWVHFLAIGLTAVGAAASAEIEAVTLVLGAKDGKPSSWNGSASISAGEIVRIKGYHFRRQDRILPGNAWECATHPWPTSHGGMHPHEQPQPHQTLVIPTGVTIEYRAPADAKIHIKLPVGEFSFRPSDIPENGAIFPLRGRIEIHRTPVIERLTTEEYHDDYPSIAVDGDTVWVAWLAYKDGKERVYLRARRAGRWEDPIAVAPEPADRFGTAVAAANGTVMVVWSEREGESWRLKYRTYDGSRLSDIATITPGNGNNLFHRMTTDGEGAFHLVWQSWRGRRSDIFYRRFDGEKWSEEINLSDPGRPERANDWSPAVAVDSTGTAWVAWDGYARGSYNIYLRSVRNGRAGALLPVTDSTRYHAHASLAVDRQDRLWIAWDEAPANWGKDVGFLLTGGTSLYEARDIRVAVFSAGQWMEPVRQPSSVVPWGFKRYFHTPRLVTDAGGRVWLFARPRTECRIPHTRWAAGGKWEIVATFYNRDRWADLIRVPDSVAGNEGELQVAADSEGNVLLAALTDNRYWGGAAGFGEKPGNHDIIFARLRTSWTGSALLAARTPEPPNVPFSEPLERDQIRRLREYKVVVSGTTYHIFRGDLHRHTDHSTDGSGDGSLWDAYRYAMDAAGMDYLLVTDHHSHITEYLYRRNDRAADMFHIPGFFTAFYGYERSLSYPNGHRNVLLTKRGIPILPNAPGERQAKVNSGAVLYPYLRKYGGLATSHTPHTGMGTDWRDNDPALEPIVEIFQGARTSAEHEGAPLAPTADRTDLQAGGYRPLGFVWNAWKKGYKLGVQASSDHVSTHTSYACVIARDGSREALVEAMRARHTYAATSNIILDYQVSVDGTSYLQGDSVTARTLPRLAARIMGTAPLKEVVIVRDNSYIYTTHPDGDTHLLSFQETALEPGEHYYYVRVEQTDGRVAWSSPVWVLYEGE